MDRKLLLLSSLLLVLAIPSALLAAEPVAPAPAQAVQAEAPGCTTSQDLLVQILGDQPLDPLAPAPPFAEPQNRDWCGACLESDCSDPCPCGGYVYACAPRCTPICWCFSC